MADNRVFGVDLNPVAVELAQISLWLNTIYEGHTIPWFGAQLAVGNSLIGARRQVFMREQIVGKERAWLEGVPERVKPGEVRPEGAVYHWLLPDSGMANYTDRAVKQMTGDATQAHRSVAARVFGAFHARAMQRRWSASPPPRTSSGRSTPRTCALSAPAQRRHFRFSARKTIPPFVRAGRRPPPSDGMRSGAAFSIRARGPAPTSGSSWPWITGAPCGSGRSRKPDLLPTRDQFLFELSAILEGTVQGAELMRPEQGALFDDGGPRQQQLEVLEDHGQVDLEALVERSERLKLVRKLRSGTGSFIGRWSSRTYLRTAAGLI